MFDIRKIQVYRNEKDKAGTVQVKKPKKYEMIGVGFHGAVFKYSSDKCIKIFANRSDAKAEAKVYRAMADNEAVPKLYSCGGNFIIIDYIKGITLRDYLYKKGDMPASITKQLLCIIRNTKYKDYNLMDVELNNIIVEENENLKLIDLCGILWMEARPDSLFKELNNIGALNSFLIQLKQLDYELFQIWELLMTEYRSTFSKIREQDILNKDNKVNYINKAIILTYHNVGNQIYDSAELNSVTITTETFISHLQGLKDYGFNVISLRQLLDAVQGNCTMPPNAAAITFEDGKASFYSDAYPILLNYNFPTVNFIITGLTECNKNSISDSTVLSPDQITEMHCSGLVDIQSHTHDSHRLEYIDGYKTLASILSNKIYDLKDNVYESNEQYKVRITQDLLKSRRIIDEYIGIKPDVLSFPFGEYNNELIEIAEECGFKYFLTVDEGYNTQGSKAKIIYRIEDTKLCFEDLLYKMLSILSI